MFGKIALALVFVGLLAGWSVWWRWQRGALANQVTAVQLTRFHAVMSQTNRLILRRPNPSELVTSVCELCVEAGHMDVAVAEMLDVGEIYRATAELPPALAVASTVPLLADVMQMQTLMRTLVRAREDALIVDDTATDDRLIQALSCSLAGGLQSLAAIPLRRGGEFVGMVLLGSRTRSLFAGQVTPLVSELGADLSFALDNADRERDRHSALLADRARVIAEEANRAKTDFLARMSHELRTPLNAMLGFAQLLATDRTQVLSKSQAERMRHITHAGWHLLGLVNDVMDISRIESGHFEVVNVRGDISSVLDEAVALSQPLARTHKVLLAEREVSKFGIGAVADPRRLLQVMLNLLSNACKYNRPGGHVSVVVSHRSGEVRLDVVDNGIGMSREDLCHLFEPFNRLGNEGDAIEGSGIGLTLARRLVEMMNGRLEIESRPDSGTRARVVLPSCAIPVKASADETLGPGAVRGAPGSAVVLYIEDEPVNQILVEQMLLRCDGVRLLQAENGADGIALARSVLPDLVLLDMHLPDMTGFDVIAALRGDPLTEGLQVVAVSANAIPADMTKAMDLGALGYWTKPLKLDAFVAGVSALVGPRLHSEVAGRSVAAKSRPAAD